MSQPQETAQANDMLPVDIVFHPSWWHKHTHIVFDEDYFYHPLKRVESERKMEAELYERFGHYGLGEQRNNDLPVVGPVHNAAGYLLSEMLGCDIRYHEDAAPSVLSADLDTLHIDPESAFTSPAFKRFDKLCDTLKEKYGYLSGDVNWSGVLNIALDLRGQNIFLDMLDDPQAVTSMFSDIADVITRMVNGVQSQTKSSSISVNRTVRHFSKPIWLHSACSNTMISTDDYERFLLPIDSAWSMQPHPFGVHHCGNDPHRFAASYAKIPRLDFLDVGWGGDLKILRQHLPDTFLNIRLDPVQLNNWSTDTIRETITRLVADSANPKLTGICCINLDDQVRDEQINTIFDTVKTLRKMYSQPPA